MYQRNALDPQSDSFYLSANDMFALKTTELVLRFILTYHKEIRK